MEFQALQEGDGPVLPSSLQQIQQVPFGERTVLADQVLGGLPMRGAGCREGHPCTSRDQEVKAVFQGSRGGALTAPFIPMMVVSLEKGQADIY